jgi:hypothetical protein
VHIIYPLAALTMASVCSRVISPNTTTISWPDASRFRASSFCLCLGGGDDDDVVVVGSSEF